MKLAKLMDGADASTTQISVWQPLGDLTELSLHVKFSSNTLNGTLTLEADDVNIVDPALAADPVTVTGSNQAVVSGASHIWNVSTANYGQIRVKWVPSSGTGTISVAEVMKEKGLNRN